MSKKTANSGGNRAQRELATADCRTGMAKDQLIFLIICSVAVAVAAVTLAFYFMGSSGDGPNDWQCPKCEYKFAKSGGAGSLVYCPKCEERAAKLSYRICRQCGAKNVASRSRISKEGEAIVLQHEGKDYGMLPPGERQYWIKQPDGSYGWSDWQSSGAMLKEITRTAVCSECGVKLYGRR